MKPVLLFYNQHVLGMGHLVRSRELVRALTGFEVWFVNGGEPAAGFGFPKDVKVVQLPPIASDAEFRGIDATEALKAERAKMLVDLFRQISPSVIAIEMFPFGRRKFAFELTPLLEENRGREARAQVVSSVRDILVSKKDQDRHERFACDLLNRHFDLVMVHSDPAFQQLGETFTRAGEIRCPVTYTGFVAEAVTGPAGETKTVPHIVASVGGGRVGYELLESVVEASRGLAMKHRLSVFGGPYQADAEFEALRSLAAGAAWIEVERYTPEFVNLLAQADLLVSMGGYNTCMNIVTTGIRSLIFPFTGNGNEEQTIRARKLERLGIVSVLEPQDLEPAAMGVRIERELDTATPARARLNLDGAQNAARLLREIVEKSAAHV